MTDLLEVENLGTWFYTRQGIVKAVDGVDFAVASGETLAIVGESGCGKSMTALSLMRLIPDPPGRIVSGAIKLGGKDLLKRLQDEFGSAVIMITHDLGVVAETADDVIVMYAAHIVERGPVRSIFNEPRHPYTWGLMGSLPRLDIKRKPPSLFEYAYEDFALVGYQAHPSIKAPIAV